MSFTGLWTNEPDGAGLGDVESVKDFELQSKYFDRQRWREANLALVFCRILLVFQFVLKKASADLE